MPKHICQWILYASLTVLAAGCGGTTNPGSVTPGPANQDGDTQQTETPPAEPGKDGNADDGGSTGNGGGAANVAKVHLIAESPNLPSAATPPRNGENGANGLELQAILTDSNNRLIEGAEVEFATSSGVLASADSSAAAVLYNRVDEPKERSITVTARSGGISDSVIVEVTGNDLSVSGPPVISAGQQATYRAVLVDSAGDGITGRPISIVSDSGNTITATNGTLETNGEGVVEFTVTAVVSGQDRLVVSALDGTEKADIDISVDAAVFAISSPPQGGQVNIGEDVQVKVVWKDAAGDPVANKEIIFFSSRGQFDDSTVTTNDSGVATATLNSSSAGPTSIVVKSAGMRNLSDTRQVQFIAIDPASLVLKADSEKVTPQSTTTVTATVRDSQGNPVTGINVTFSAVGTTAGSLSPSVDETGIFGQASTVFTAGAASSEPVTIKARVPGEPISQSVQITIAGEPLFITLGTGRLLTESPDPATLYSVPYTVYVTDAAGNPIPGVQVELAIQSIAYQEGHKKLTDTDGDGEPDAWLPNYEVGTAGGGYGCAAEDADHDGVLDAGEDANGNGVLDPGGVAQVPASVDLDQNGLAEFKITYGKQYSGWVKVRLTATRRVEGSENTDAAEFVLPMGAEDHKADVPTPPGQTSPFGTDGICATPQ